MNLKKPDFWTYDKPNFYAYLLSPFSILIQLLNLLNLKKKLSPKLKQYVLEISTWAVQEKPLLV